MEQYKVIKYASLLVISSFIIFIVYAAMKMEIHDSENKESFRQQLWNKEIVKDKNCLNYLNIISSYPHWRLCAMFSFFMCCLILPLFKLINSLSETQGPPTRNDETTFFLQFVVGFLVIMIGCIKLIDYFRWHVMCGGWGCTGY